MGSLRLKDEVWLELDVWEFKTLRPVTGDRPDSGDRSWRVGAESEEVQGAEPGALEPAEVDG